MTRLFNFKRCVLETRVPLAGGGEAAVLTTHLDAFAQGTNTMERQVSAVLRLLGSLDSADVPWVIGGDFNLLPSDSAYSRLPQRQRAYFRPRTEIGPLSARFQAVPSLQEANGASHASWFTHFPNDPAGSAPDRTIDYIFVSDSMNLGTHRVRQADAMAISDHFPVVAEVRVPAVLTQGTGPAPPVNKHAASRPMMMQ